MALFRLISSGWRDWDVLHVLQVKVDGGGGDTIIRVDPEDEETSYYNAMKIKTPKLRANLGLLADHLTSVAKSSALEGSYVMTAAQASSQMNVKHDTQMTIIYNYLLGIGWRACNIEVGLNRLTLGGDRVIDLTHGPTCTT